MGRWSSQESAHHSRMRTQFWISKNVKELNMVVHTFNTSTRKWGQARSLTVTATQRNIFSEKEQNTHQNKIINKQKLAW